MEGIRRTIERIKRVLFSRVLLEHHANTKQQLNLEKRQGSEEIRPTYGIILCKYLVYKL